jgi:hypothetical protein
MKTSPSPLLHQPLIINGFPCEITDTVVGSNGTRYVAVTATSGGNRALSIEGEWHNYEKVLEGMKS